MVEDEDRSIQTGKRLLAVVGSFVAFLALRVVLDGTVSVGGSILLTPSVGLAVPLGILFGLPAAVGILAGSLTAQGLQAGLPLLGIFESMSLFVLAAISAVGWQSEIQLRTGTVLDVDGVTGFVVVATVGTVGAASVFAWGGELLGLFPFYVMFVETLIRYLVATAVVVPVVVAPTLVSRPNRLRSTEPSATFGPGFVLVPVLWAGLALVGSLGFNIRERIPQAAFENLGIEFLYHLVHPDVFGGGGRRIQVAFGAVMLVVWAVPVGRAKRSGPTESATAAHGNDSASQSLDSEQTTVSSRTDDLEVR